MARIHSKETIPYSRFPRKQAYLHIAFPDKFHSLLSTRSHPEGKKSYITYSKFLGQDVSSALAICQQRICQHLAVVHIIETIPCSTPRRQPSLRI